MKMYSRDVSRQQQQKHETTRLFREMERWIGEAKLAAGGSNLPMAEDGEEWKEQWAIDQLCESLLKRGCMVSTSER